MSKNGLVMDIAMTSITKLSANLTMEIAVTILLQMGTNIVRTVKIV